MTLNKFICLTCGHWVMLHPDHPANNRAKDGIVYRGSCEICTPLKKKAQRREGEKPHAAGEGEAVRKLLGY